MNQFSDFRIEDRVQVHTYSHCGWEGYVCGLDEIDETIQVRLMIDIDGNGVSGEDCLVWVDVWDLKFLNRENENQ